MMTMTRKMLTIIFSSLQEIRDRFTKCMGQHSMRFKDTTLSSVAFNCNLHDELYAYFESYKLCIDRGTRQHTSDKVDYHP